MNRYQLWCYFKYPPHLPLLDGWVLVGFYTHVDVLEKVLEEFAKEPLCVVTEYKIVHVCVTAEGEL